MSTIGKSALGGKALPSLVLSLAFVLGCVSSNKKLSTDSIASPSPITHPKEKRLEELPVLQLEEKVKKPEPPRVYSLSVRDASIRDVLLSFSKESKTNIIVDPDVSGNVIIDLKDVTLPQAMDALLTPMGLEYKLEDGFVRVSKPKPITRIFRLNYVITQRSGSRALSTSSGVGTGVLGLGIGGVPGIGGIGGISGTGGISGIGGIGTTGTLGGLGGIGGGAVGTTGGGFTAGFNTVTGTDIQDIFREMELALSAMGLKSAGMIGIGTRGIGAGAGAAGAGVTEPVPTRLPSGVRGVFSINRQAGLVLVTAFPDLIAKVAELLEAVEGTIQRQVLIHAKIVEVTLRDEFRYGINYDLLFGLHREGRRDLSVGQSLEQESRKLLPTIARDIKKVEGLFQFTIRTGDMESILEALSFQGDVNVISSPKISTLNNQTAIIKVGTQKTFFTVSTITTSPSGGLPQTTEGVTTNTITIGVTLDVTPQISPDGYITMSVHPSISDQVDVTKSRKGDEAPVLEVRETDTVIRAKDGETIVMGGLMQERKELQENRVPLLGKIPGLGTLFKQVDNKKKKVDLVIFLTPTILVGDRIEDLSTEELKRLKLSEK